MEEQVKYENLEHQKQVQTLRDELEKQKLDFEQQVMQKTEEMWQRRSQQQQEEVEGLSREWDMERRVGNFCLFGPAVLYLRNIKTRIRILHLALRFIHN